MLGDKTAFLNQYAIPEKMYEEAGMSWADLEAIAEDYAYPRGRLLHDSGYVFKRTDRK